MGTCYKGTEEEIRALNTYIKLMRATESVTARIHGYLKNDGLTISQLGVLESLFHLGPMHQREIGAKILKSGGNMTVVIDNLEKRGLVKRVRGENDRRFITIHLTEEGNKLIDRIFPVHVAAVSSEFKRLDKAEMEELGRICKKLGLKEVG